MIDRGLKYNMQTAVKTLLLFLLRYLSRDSYRDTLGNNRDFLFFFVFMLRDLPRVAEKYVPFDGPARHWRKGTLQMNSWSVHQKKGQKALP